MKNWKRDTRNEPPPLYKDDPAWSPDREQRADDLFDAYNDKRTSPQETLEQIAILIEEIETALRAGAGPCRHRTLTEGSPLLQRLLYAHYHTGKKAAASESRSST